MILALLGCGPGDPTLLLEADPARDGLDGRDGAYAVAALDVRQPARVTGMVPVRVVYPADGDLAPAVEDAPLVVIIPGGLVDAERYDWLAVHLASRGMAVALPSPASQLAILEPGDGEVAVDAVRDLADADAELPHLIADGSPIAVAGHSLGGVMAARQWVRDPHVDGLLLLASFAAAGDPVGDQVGRPVLALAGTEDGSVDLDQLPTEIQRFGGPAWLGWVAGLNHYSWTDDPTPGELRKDGNPVGSREDHLRDAQRVIDAYFDAVFAGEVPPLGLPTPGITWAF